MVDRLAAPRSARACRTAAAAFAVGLVLVALAPPALAQKTGGSVAPSPAPAVPTAPAVPPAPAAPPKTTPAPSPPSTLPGPVVPVPAAPAQPPSPPSPEVTVAPEPAAPPEPPAPPVIVEPVPTSDATPAPTDHDAVVGHLGLEAFRVGTFALRPTGCPTAATTCSVTLGAVGARYWWSRNVAFEGALALGFGGGRASKTQALDTSFGVGPIVGMSLLLGNWRHVAILASPQAGFVWFKPAVGDGGDTVKVLTLRATLEGELHFGFVGLPALSIGLATGLGFRWQSGEGQRFWSLDVVQTGSVRDLLTSVFVRYYL